MKPVALRVLSCFVCLATSVAVASCEVTPLAQTLSRAADAGKAALDILALIGKSDAGADALRHENTLISFASRAKDLPQSVQEKIWTDEFVSRLREGIQEDNVGFALTDSPRISVVETRPSRGRNDRTLQLETFYDVFLQLEYSSVERSYMTGSGAFLRKTGIGLRLVEDAKGGFLWRSWRLIPEMDEPWRSAPDMLVACDVSMGCFSCVRSSAE